MINKTKIRIPKKYQPFISDITYCYGLYELNLKECCDIDGGSHMYSYETQRELLSELPGIWIISSEKKYKRLYGDDGLINDYREDYKAIKGEYPPEE